MPTTISFSDFKSAGKRLGVAPCMLSAVAQVESGGAGFRRDGKVVVRFEKHVFIRELRKQNASGTMLMKAKSLTGSNMNTLLSAMSIEDQDIAMSSVERALQLDDYCALMATSWGMFQIMGFNHKLAGYDTVQSFVEDQAKGEREQLGAFCTFLKNNHLVPYLFKQQYAEFARRYNGPGYRANRYDTKLKDAYLKCLKAPA